MRSSTVKRAGRTAARPAAACAVAAVAVLAAGCGSGGGDTAAPGPGQDAGATASADPSADGGADSALYDTAAHRLIEQAFAGEKFIECTARESTDTVTAYVDGEDRMRIDGGTGPDAGHLLTVDGVTYVWSDDEPGGMKTTGPASGGMKTMIEGMGVNLDAARELSGGEGGIDEDAALGCSDYDGDGSVFDVPSDREFTSVDDALESAPGVVAPGGATGPGDGSGGD